MFGKDLIPIANKIKEKHKESFSTSNFKIADEDISDLFSGFLDEDGIINKDKATMARGILVLIEKLLKRANYSEKRIKSIIDKVRPVINFLAHESPTIEHNLRKRRNKSDSKK